MTVRQNHLRTPSTPTMNLDASLPTELRGSSTTISKVAAGLSGAGVYKVAAPSGTFVLKISGSDQPLADWQHKLHSQQLAANAGLAPRVEHTDEARRSVVSEFVVDRSFPALFANPATRESAITLLGRTLRRVHELPLKPGSLAPDTQTYLAAMLAPLERDVTLPEFVVDAVQRVRAEPPPTTASVIVLSHNDVNPTNLVYDGERLLLLDWDASGPNNAYYDLAVISVFLRMDGETCQKLIAAHDDAPVTSLPAEFSACRRMAAVLCGAMFLRMARAGGHPGATPTDTLEATLSLSTVYQRLRDGAVNIAAAEGQWLLGLALVKESLAS
ncbi:MAG: phosphotransferase [bacterium]